jgi:hypothetical protein
MTYLLMRHGNSPWENLSLEDLGRIICKLYPDHEWPEGEKELIDEINAFDPVALRVVREA